MSKGKMLIEAFRAERLKQRQALRGSVCEEASVLVQAGPAMDGAHDAVPPDAAGFETSIEITGPAPVHGPQPDATAVEVRHAAAPAPCTCGERSTLDQAAAHAAERWGAPLTDIGIGPAMTVRLGQLGCHSLKDLAHADAAGLRALLGDMSRLLDVDAWIGAARRRLGMPDI